jgi:hypothetical protein
MRDQEFPGRTCQALSSARGGRIALASLLLAAALLSSGCAAITALFGPGRDVRFQKAVLAYQPSEAIDELLKDAVQSSYNDPKHVREARGASIGVALASLGQGERREQPLFGGFQPEKRFDAGRLDPLMLAFYYWAKRPEIARFRQDDVARDKLRQALRTRSVGDIGVAIDAVTDTQSGDFLEGKQFEEFKNKRLAPNQWLKALSLHPPLRTGYKKVETLPSPRDAQLGGPAYDQRSEVAAEALAKLIGLAGLPTAFAPEEARELLNDLTLNPADAPRDNALSSALPSGARLWSASSSDNDGYHVAGLIQMNDGNYYAVAILTDRADKGGVLARLVAKKIVDGIRAGRVPIPRVIPK